MSSIFSMDNLFFRAIGKITDLIWLNLLTVVCCLPVFTAGAAITAMYSVTLRMAEGTEGTITKSYFKAFRDNFKRSTQVWIGVMFIGIIYLLDIRLIGQGIIESIGVLGTVIKVATGIVVLVLFMVTIYLFPIISSFDNSIKMTILNAIKLAVAFLPKTLSMIMIWLFPMALTLLSNYFILVWFLIGFSLPGFMSSLILIRIFESIQK